MSSIETRETSSFLGLARPGGRLFYGWYLVAAVFVVNLAYGTTLSSTLSVFLKPMEAEFGLPRSALSLVRSLEALLGGALAPLLGGTLDRHGARLPLVVGGLITGGSLLGQALVQEAWQLYLLRLVPLTVGSLLLSQVVTTVAISNWFVRRRGRAIAIAGLGWSWTKILVPPLVAWMLVAWGWRSAWIVLGGMTWLLVMLPSALIVRRRPEDLGLYPDGEPPPDAEETSQKSSGGRSPTMVRSPEETLWTRREALRTQALWLIIFTFGIANVGIMGLNLHLFPYLTEIGFPETQAAWAMSAIAAGQLLATLFWGFIVERIDVRQAATVKFLVQAVGLVLALLIHEPLLLLAVFFFYGLGLGGSFVIQEVMWASFYGRLSLGTVRSIGMPFTWGFAAFGPLFFGVLHDVSGSYTSSFVAFIGTLVLAGLLVLLIRPPGKGSLSGSPSQSLGEGGG